MARVAVLRASDVPAAVAGPGTCHHNAVAAASQEYSGAERDLQHDGGLAGRAAAVLDLEHV